MQGPLLRRANQGSADDRLGAAELTSISLSGRLLRGSTTRVVAVVDRPGQPEDVPRLWGAETGPTTCHSSCRAGGSVGRVLKSEHAADHLS